MSIWSQSTAAVMIALDAQQVVEAARIKTIEEKKEDTSKQEQTAEAAQNEALRQLLKKLYEATWDVVLAVRTYRQIKDKVGDIQKYIQFLQRKIRYIQQREAEFTDAEIDYYIMNINSLIRNSLNYIEDILFLLTDGLKGMNFTDGERIQAVEEKMEIFDQLQLASANMMNQIELRLRSTKSKDVYIEDLFKK